MKQSEYIISKFGGIHPMARAMELRPSTVQGWMERGWIPPRRYSEILKAARLVGVPLAKEDFVAHLPCEGAAA